jgi:hypothetical protein
MIYQFTPHDVYDYDSVQVPVLVDNWAGSRINVVTWANRNGNFYVIDRETGRFLLGRPFVKVNWMSEFDERGRPRQTPQPDGQPTYPGNQGGTNWYSPSFSQRTGLFYVSAWEDYASIYAPAIQRHRRVELRRTRDGNSSLQSEAGREENLTADLTIGAVEQSRQTERAGGNSSTVTNSDLTALTRFAPARAHCIHPIHQ